MNIILISFLILFKAFNSDFFNIDFNKIINVLFNIHKTLLSKKNTEYWSCFQELENFFIKPALYFQRNPQLLPSLGKGIDDIGNELECLESNLDQDYILLKYNFTSENFSFIDLATYLDRSYSFMGFCLPRNCSGLVDTIKNYSNEISGLKDLVKDFKFYHLTDIKNNNLFDCIFWISVSIIALKLVISIYSKIKFPKGYSYHGFNLYLKMPDELINTINAVGEEKKEKVKKKDNLISENIENNNDSIKSEDINLKGGYNPKYDFEPFYPMYFRLIKYLDIFNNFSIFVKKRNRYYNETHINLLCPIKALILYYHIYNETIRLLIRLPNPTIFSYKFYGSYGLFIYKRSINSFVFWIILESATFSFKLMKFIHKNISKKKNKKNKNAYIFKQSLKFLIFYIPKIIIYSFVFIFFYYLAGKYTCNFTSKMIYHYTYSTQMKSRLCNKGKNIFEDLSYAFLPFMKYNTNTDYLKMCYPFTYLYSNMLFSSLVFMLLLNIIFYTKNKIFDIIIFILVLLNLIINYILFFIKSNKFYSQTNNEDENKEKKEVYTFFYHYSGETYSILYPYIFFSFYFLGCLLGLCFYYYSEYLIMKKNKLKNSQQNNNNNYRIVKDSLSKENNSFSISVYSQSNTIKSKTNKVNLFYQPMEFCSTFIIKLKTMKVWIKILLLCICIILSIFLGLINNILISHYQSGKKNKGFEFTINSKFHPFKLIYFFEKILNVILFLFTICLILVLPKDYLIIRFMKSYAFLPISRSGLFATCVYQSLLYIFYSLFQLEIQIGFLMIFYIVIGLYIIFLSLSIFGTILIELPFRILFKNLLKSDDNKQSRKMLIKMRNLDQ